MLKLSFTNRNIYRKKNPCSTSVKTLFFGLWALYMYYFAMTTRFHEKLLFFLLVMMLDAVSLDLNN